VGGQGCLLVGAPVCLHQTPACCRTLAFHTIGRGCALLMCACLCLLLPAVEDLVAQIARESPEAQQLRAQQSTFNEFNTGVRCCAGSMHKQSKQQRHTDAWLQPFPACVLSFLLPPQAKEQLADEQAYREKMEEQKAEGDPQAQAEGMLKMKTAKIRKAR
jgi:hypothetical protein